jgi:signal transduction histidine kinase
MMGPMSESASTEPSPAADPEGAALREKPWSSSVIGIGVSAFSPTPRIRFATRLAELAIGTGFVLVALPTSSPKHTLGVVAAVISGIVWLAWILAGEDRRRALVALVALSLTGGVCAAAHPTGLLFVFVATAAAAYSFAIAVSMAVFLAALAAFVVTGLATSFPDHPSSLATFGLIAIALGFSRRQLLERGRESTLLATAERRAILADREAQVVTERNHLGREIHDVLAHTLGAVSIQLTALDSRLAAGDTSEALRARVRSLHDLVGDGLEEARDAVRALRDDQLPLETQIRRLCTLHEATLRIDGPSRPMRADEALVLYRVVQEALTNAAKHAPGAPVDVTLAVESDTVTVTAHNGPAPAGAGRLATSGGGNGLAGMRARVELVGGDCVAGPEDDGGWLVTARLPHG